MAYPREPGALASEIRALRPAGVDAPSSMWPEDAVPVPDYPLSQGAQREQKIARFLLGRAREMLRLRRMRPIERHGRKLDPQMQLLLALRAQQGQTNLLLGDSPAQARVQVRMGTLRFAQAEPAMASVHEFRIPGPGGSLRVRHYVPHAASEANSPLPLMVFLHGGGFTVCDLDTHDQPCRTIADRARVQVLSVDYRLSPEHPYPAPVEDARAAFAWAAEHAGMLGADPKRVGVAGDSAGGNLATVTALMALREGGPVPHVQFLIYPVVDADWTRPSRVELSRDFGLTLKDMEWSTQNYTAFDEALQADPAVVPIRAKSLAGMPRAVILTAGFDPLRDEGNDYAQVLRAAGTDVLHFEAEGMVHGFINMASVSTSARDALQQGCDQLAALL